MTPTPTPWAAQSVKDHGYPGFAIKTAASLAGGFADRILDFDASKPNAAANAAFIVRACNAHADLLAALQECITDDPGAACYNTGRKTRRLAAISDTARAAIAKATQ